MCAIVTSFKDWSAKFESQRIATLCAQPPCFFPNTHAELIKDNDNNDIAIAAINSTTTSIDDNGYVTWWGWEFQCVFLGR